MPKLHFIKNTAGAQFSGRLKTTDLSGFGVRVRVRVTVTVRFRIRVRFGLV